jgi:hypothetical protein
MGKGIAKSRQEGNQALLVMLEEKQGEDKRHSAWKADNQEHSHASYAGARTAYVYQ